MTNGRAVLTHWSIHQKLNRVSSVQFSYIALYAPLVSMVLWAEMWTDTKTRENNVRKSPGADL